MRTLAIVGLIALAAEAGTAQASFQDGNDLLAICQETASLASDRYFQRGYCLGYILARCCRSSGDYPRSLWTEVLPAR